MAFDKYTWKEELLQNLSRDSGMSKYLLHDLQLTQFWGTLIFSLLLARFRTYASSYASFANSPAGFYQIRTWMLWKLPGTRLFRVGWKKHLACLCFSTLNKKFEVKFERISLPQRGSEPGTPSLWVRCANHYTTDPFVIWRQKLVDYILQCCFWIKMG